MSVAVSTVVSPPLCCTRTVLVPICSPLRIMAKLAAVAPPGSCPCASAVYGPNASAATASNDVRNLHIQTSLGGRHHLAKALVQKCRSRAWGGAAAERYGATPSSAGRPMPYKFNEPRRHKIPRARYRVQNWPEYDRTLQRRGDLTVWVTPEAIAAWCPPRTGRRGRPRDYSDVAIETGHLLRLAFGRPWRQTEGLLRSLATLLGLDIGVPDHTTFSRRSPGLTLARSLAQAQRT